MSGPEQLFCRSAPWRWWTRTTVLPWALQGVRLTGDVLEVGAGSGSMALGTLDTHPGARLTLTDIDPKMVAAADQRLGHRPGVTAQQADASQLRYEDSSFDYVVSYLMLHHVIGWETALTEMHRVLRPGGRVVGYDLTNTFIARAIHWVDRSPHRLIEPQQLGEGLTAAGFAGVTVRTGWAGHVMRFIASR